MKNNNRFMLSGINQHFPTQKMVSDLRLKETLRSISPHRGYDDEEIPAYLDSDKPVIYIMKSVLKAADIPENLFDKSMLKNRYDEYVRYKREGNAADSPDSTDSLNATDSSDTTDIITSADITDNASTKDESEILFTIDQLFEEGWLIDCGNEWMHNCRPKRYKGLTFADSDREEQIIDFLVTLSDTNVCDVVLTFDPNKNADLLTALNTSVDELLKTGIFYVGEETTADAPAKEPAESNVDDGNDGGESDHEHEHRTISISSHTEIWKSLGSFVLSSLLDEWLEGGTDADCYSTWLNYCRYLKYAWTPERYVTDKEALYSYCLKMIKALHSNEKTESQRLSRALCISANSKERSAEIPSNPRIREEYFSQRVDYSHELQFISNIHYTLAGTAVDMCCRLYSHVPIDTRKGLTDVLADPYFSILNHYDGYLMNPDLGVDAMKQERLCYISLVTIYGEFRRKVVGRTSDIYAVEKFAYELWDVVYNELLKERRDGAVASFVEFLIYLGQSCDFGEEREQNSRGRSVLGHNKTALTFFSTMLEKYTDELGEYEPVDGKVRGYIIDSLCGTSGDVECEAENDTISNVEITRFLRMLFAFAGQRSNNSNSYEQWLICSLEQLAKQYKICADGSFNISLIPLRSITTIVEKYSDEADANRLYLLAREIIEKAKKIQNDGYTDKANRRWGGYIGLSILIAAINGKSRASELMYSLGNGVQTRSKGQVTDVKSEIELLLDTIIPFQKSDRIFSRENIYQFEVEELFKDCMSTMPLFSKLQREKFVTNACDDTGKVIQKIDLLTWSALIEDNNIRIRLIELVTDGVGKVEALDIVKVVADSVIMPFDFTDIVNLAIWYKEEFIGEESDHSSASDAEGDADNCDASVESGHREVRSEDAVLSGLIDIAEAMLDRYKKWEKQVGSYLKDRRNSVAAWIASAERQLEYIRGEKDALRQSDDDFFKGIGYLESRNEDSLIEAARIFGKVYETRGTISAGINLMSALAQLINVRRDSEHSVDHGKLGDVENQGNDGRADDRFDVSNGDIPELLRQIEDLYDEISERIDNGEYIPEYGFYYNILLTYALCGKADEFWNVYRVIPDTLVLEPFITELAVRVYISEGKKEKAQRLYEKCKKKYFAGKKLEDIKMIIDTDGQEVPEMSNLPKNLGGSDEPTQIEINRVLNYLKRAPGDEILKAFGNCSVAQDDLLQKMGISRLNDGYDKILVLEMLLSAALDLEKHSRSMLWKWKNGIKVPNEDTFNRTLMMFINRRETRVLGYKASDQTQAGRSGKNSDHRDAGNDRLLEDEELEKLEDAGLIDPKNVSQLSMGEIDILIEKGESNVCIIEGIKAFRKFEKNQGLTNNIVDHISKVHTYDTKRIRLYAMMVYSGSYEGNYTEIYDQYKNLLMKLREGYDGEGEDDSGCYIVDVMTDVLPRDLGILGDSRNYQHLCITIHRNPKKHMETEKIIMYHLFLDVWQ